MKKFRHQADRRQIALLPASIDEYIPANDIVRYIDAMIDELDLAEMESAYANFGRPAYHPRVLVKILLYGKMRGMRSSRELARAARENLRFIFLSNNEKPDFRTIVLFRKRFHKELAALFQQTIHIGLQEAVIDLDHVSIDGTKLRAFAGRNSFKRPETLQADLAQLERELAESIAKDIEIDGTEDNQYRGQDMERPLPAGLEQKQALRAKVKAALQAYNDSKTPKPKRMSITDPDSRYMKGKGILPSYNGQAAVDRKSRMAVGGFISNACTDSGLLSPMLEEIERNTQRNPTTVTADSGYADYAALVDLEDRGIDGYIPRRVYSGKRFAEDDFTYDAEDDCYRCPNHRLVPFKEQRPTHRIYACLDCRGCALRAQCLRHVEQKHPRTLSITTHKELVNTMRKKTATDKGKAMATIRGSTVEPLFGYLKYSKKLSQFLIRGKAFIDSMWKLELAAYNIERLAKWAQQRAIPASAIYV